MYVQGDGWLDSAAQRLAVESASSSGPQSVLNTGDWIDRPSVGIPYLYVATGIELAEAMKGQGKTAEATKLFKTAKSIAHVVRLDDLLRPAEAEFAQPLTGDTARSQTLPSAVIPAPAPAKTDTLSKPGAKGAAKGPTKGAAKP